MAAIKKIDFQTALDLDAEAEAAQAEYTLQRDLAISLRGDLRAALAALGLDSNDPFATALVEHEGTVYRVTATDIKPLAVETTV